MGRGFMRQSVHPMEANSDGEKRKLGMEEDDWQDVATENSSQSVQQETTGHNRGPTLGLDPTTAPDVMTQDQGPARPPLMTRNSNPTFEEDELEGAAEVLSPPQSGGGNDYNVAKSGRLLTFADETGGSLVEMNYSNRTHYSKQAGPGAVQGVQKGGCCIIQ